MADFMKKTLPQILLEVMQMKPWKDWFQPHILERGRAYFDEGRVSELERTRTATPVLWKNS